uniref:Uncharacterized protein n=1 Tax=Caenorhabditis japonica TaxID=281687 RepID=A0A8R1DM70_CAEJA
MRGQKGSIPFFHLTVFILILTTFEANSLTNFANFEFEKSLSSCEKPCFNGVCLNRTCICSKGWYGSQCDHCNGRIRLTESSNFISDGPLDYSSSSKCTWLIEPEINSSNPLTIKVDNFLTECGWDYLYIYDGDSIYGKQLAALCDLAMNMDGFNVSYISNRCAYNCSNHGSCENGNCVCENGYAGQHCEQEVCRSDGDSNKNPCNQGTCSDDKCDCSSSMSHGTFCQKPVTSSVWDVIRPTESLLYGKASHASLTIDNAIWNIGGDYFDNSKKINFIEVFNVTSLQWNVVVSKNEEPLPRFDHTVVRYKNKLFMFGGVIKKQSEAGFSHSITNELWVFDTTLKTWTIINNKNNSTIRAPFAVSGHTAHIIGSDMFIFFGYNPYFGFMHHVQVYNIETEEWRVADTSNHVFGRFKHSSIEHVTKTGSIEVLVYGGSMANNTVTDSLIMFDTKSQKWTNLPQSGVQMYLHSAVYHNGLMIVFGGRGANATAGSKNECFLNKIMSYDLACKQWLNMSDAPNAVKRYGHTSQVVQDKIYLIGGFNGKMLSDVWTITSAQCHFATKPDECRLINDGIKCIFVDGLCQPFDPKVSYKTSFLDMIKSSNPKLMNDCSNTPLRIALKTCEDQLDCVSCASKSGCGWCSSAEQCLPNEQECIDGPGMLTSWEKCPQRNDLKSLRPCSMENNCGSCRMNSHCTWYPVDRNKPCVSKEDLIAVVYEYETKAVSQERNKFLSTSHYPQFGRSLFRNSSECETPCAERSNCSTCVDNDQCMWCPSTNMCINLEAYTLSFAYGQCHSWVTSGSGNVVKRVCQAESSVCEEHKTCGECQRDPGCGWLADESKTGLGLCTKGTAGGPIVAKPPGSTWFFIDCPACQCNGHSTCVTTVGSFPPVTVEKCKKCFNNTIGAHCERCAPGYYGDSRNGGECNLCDCNKQADMCDSQTGQCYCRTKGVTGDHCDKCEPKYIGNPRNGTPCYYELAVDFIFTFKLKKDEKDNHTSEIFLYSVPYKKDTDVTFQISCDSERIGSSTSALVALNMTSSYIDGLPERTQTMMVDTACDSKGFRRVYVASDKGYPFGPDSNTTFFVRVYNFTTPVQIVVSFAQSPPINWVLFFVIFAACFIVLLVVAGLLWMIKVRIEAYRRNQRRIDEIQHMASRPFASTKMELSILSQLSSASGPTPLSIEPCSNYRAGIFTLAVRLPTGGQTVTPNGTSGLAVASSLCLLTPQQVGVLQAAENGESSGGGKRNLRNLLRLPIRQRPNNT